MIGLIARQITLIVALLCLLTTTQALITNTTTTMIIGAIGCCSSDVSAKQCPMKCTSSSNSLDITATDDVEGFCTLDQEVIMKNLRISFEIEFVDWPTASSGVGSISRLGGFFIGTPSMIDGHCKKKCGLIDWIERFETDNDVNVDETGVRIHGFAVPWSHSRVSALADHPIKWVLEFDNTYAGLLRADGYVFSTFRPQKQYNRGYFGFYTCCRNTFRITNLKIETNVAAVEAFRVDTKDSDILVERGGYGSIIVIAFVVLVLLLVMRGRHVAGGMWRRSRGAINHLTTRNDDPPIASLTRRHAAPIV